jgi:hypothetical protein
MKKRTSREPNRPSHPTDEVAGSRRPVKQWTARVGRKPPAAKAAGTEEPPSAEFPLATAPGLAAPQAKGLADVAPAGGAAGTGSRVPLDLVPGGPADAGAGPKAIPSANGRVAEASTRAERPLLAGEQLDPRWLEFQRTFGHRVPEQTRYLSGKLTEISRRLDDALRTEGTTAARIEALMRFLIDSREEIYMFALNALWLYHGVKTTCEEGEALVGG